MKIIRGLEQISGIRPCSVTIGTFDGVHLGHQEIIRRLREVAAEKGLCTTLITFYPHPRLIVHGGQQPVKLLTSQEEKLELLETTGLDQVLIIPFDESFSELEYNDFVRDILIKRLNAEAVVVGYDHSFGKDRQGNFANLQRLSTKFGFYAEKVDAFEVDNERIGSSRIREMIQQGKVDLAAHLLGRLYELRGTVVYGAARGRTLHFPTANLKLDYENKLIPENGVYAVDVVHINNTYKGMLNIGYKPTFETGHAFTIEVHILGFEQNIYDEQLIIKFKKRLRSEKKFDTKEALVAQLEIDKQLSLNL